MSSGAPRTSDGDTAGGSPSAAQTAAETALHDRLRHLAYVTLPPTLGRRRRARMADALAVRSVAEAAGPEAARALLVRYALHVGPRRTGLGVLHGTPRSGDAEDPSTRATERQLAAMMPAARAAYALRRLEGMEAAETSAVLGAAGVPDAETATSLADRSALEPAAVRAIQVPSLSTSARPRMVTAAAVALVIGVAAPVIAVTAAGNDDAVAPVSQETAEDAKDAEDGAKGDGKSQRGKNKGTRGGGDGAASAPAGEPSAADLGIDAAGKNASRDLDRIVRRLDEEIAKVDPAGADAARLRGLRAAVVAAERAAAP